jgi:hypothetical protein
MLERFSIRSTEDERLQCGLILFIDPEFRMSVEGQTGLLKAMSHQQLCLPPGLRDPRRLKLSGCGIYERFNGCHGVRAIVFSFSA